MGADEAQPLFLTLAEVLEIHRDQIEHYGGSDRVLSLEGLESALAQPQATFDGRYLHGDVFEMAAAYLYHIAQNHPFADGNKRVAAVTALVFLELNGHDLIAENEALEHLVMSVARGESRMIEIAAFFRSSVAG